MKNMPTLKEIEEADKEQLLKWRSSLLSDQFASPKNVKRNDNVWRHINKRLTDLNSSRMVQDYITRLLW